MSNYNSKCTKGKMAYESIHVRWKLDAASMDTTLLAEVDQVRAQVKATIWEAEAIHVLSKTSMEKRCSSAVTKYPTDVDTSLVHKSLREGFFALWDTPECQKAVEDTKSKSAPAPASDSLT